jgi:hypothetical protein
MMSLLESLSTVLTNPSPEALWQLQGDLLSEGFEPDAPIMAILDAFHNFLNELSASASAREYSHFASILDMGAVGGIAIQNLLEQRDSEGWWQRLLVGGLSESLMIIAARQYVKAWDNEMSSDINQAAWFLYREYWLLSAEMQPELARTERRRLVDQLLAPIHDSETGGTVKAALIGRLFQLLLMANFVQEAG